MSPLCILKQNTFEMTNGVKSHSSDQLHMTGSTKKTREKQSPDRDELKEAGTKRPPAEGGQNEATEQTWWINLSPLFLLFCPCWVTALCNLSDLLWSFLHRGCCWICSTSCCFCCCSCCASGLMTPAALLSCLQHTGQNKSRSVPPGFQTLRDFGLVVFKIVLFM